MNPNQFETLIAEAKVIASQFQEHKQITSVIDYTHLDDILTDEEWAEFVSMATQYGVAAVCVTPQSLYRVQNRHDWMRATVINFPKGLAPLSVCLNDIEKALSQHWIDEIDYVFNYHDFLNGKINSVFSECKALYQFTQDTGLVLKVILETGALKEVSQIYHASRLVLDAGCNFLKTSTGKISLGATPTAALAMLSAIEDAKIPAGIKYSGGIKTKEDASLYLALTALFEARPLNREVVRIGASQLLKNLAKEAREE